MKKVGIITTFRQPNWGSVLQAYALQKTIEKVGHKVILLDYLPERYTNKGKLKRLKNKSEKLKNPLLCLIAKILIYPSYIKKNRIFKQFLSKYLHLTENTFATNDEAKQLNIDADIFCTGSDQVWNSHWNEGVDETLYLGFAPKGKLCFSYAASIGLSDISQEEKKEISKLLDKYEYISVRENTGVEIIHSIGRPDAYLTLDPTLLLSKSEWNEMSGKITFNSKYVLTYNLHHDDRIDRYAQLLAKKYDLKVRNITYNWHDIVRKGHLEWCPPVENFLALIKNAEYVIADSFHATVFSIVFERPFVTITPEVASSRISSLLDMFEISEHNINTFEDTSLIETPIDYKKVKAKLDIERQKSLSYIQKALETQQFTHNN